MKAAYDDSAIFWNGHDFYGTKNWTSTNSLAKYVAEYPEHGRNISLSIKAGMYEKMKPNRTGEGIYRSVINVIMILDGKKTILIIESVSWIGIKADWSDNRRSGRGNPGRQT